jgi:hypothetical protein
MKELVERVGRLHLSRAFKVFVREHDWVQISYKQTVQAKTYFRNGMLRKVFDVLSGNEFDLLEVFREVSAYKR